jgi:Primase X
MVSPFPRAFTPFTYSPFKKGKDKLINQKQQLTDIEIESSISFILSHFEEPLYPRKISTYKSQQNRPFQFLVSSEKEIIDSFIDSDFVDCQINAYPFLTEYKDVPRYKPNFLFIDIDRNNPKFKTDIDFESALSKTLENIKQNLNGEPTVLFTGGGYHIYQPVYIKTALENIPEFQEFDRPSELLLRFAKDYLSNSKADKQNNPSFKSCLIRVPGSIRSKYNKPVQIIKKWNGIRVPITKGFIEQFRDWLIQKKIDQQKQRQQILVERAKNKFVGSSSNYYTWIEHLIQTPIEDFRKLVIDLILAPYLINIRKLSYQESYSIIRNWLDKCNELKRLDNYRNFEYRINYELNRVINNGIGPMSKEKIKTDSTYSELYQLLKDKELI